MRSGLDGPSVSVIVISSILVMVAAGFALKSQIVSLFDETPSAGLSPHEGAEIRPQVSGLSVQGRIIRLEPNVVRNIRAQAVLYGLKSAEGRGTHRLQLAFFRTNVKIGDALRRGQVAVKVTDPRGRESAAEALSLHGNQFEGVVRLPEPGRYRIYVGSRLDDGKRRQFEFFVEI